MSTMSTIMALLWRHMSMSIIILFLFRLALSTQQHWLLDSPLGQMDSNQIVKKSKRSNRSNIFINAQVMCRNGLAFGHLIIKAFLKLNSYLHQVRLAALDSSYS